jgi:hypothetical protein
MYASLFGISGALHLDVFEQPEQIDVFQQLPDADFDQRVDIAGPGIVKAFRKKRRCCAEIREEGVE